MTRLAALFAIPALLLGLCISASAESINGCRIAAATLCPESNLAESDLRGADLAHANFMDAKLTGANLAGANLKEAQLMQANLDGADLTGAVLIGADLSRASMAGTKLQKADLTNATLKGLRAEHARFASAQLNGAEMSGAKLTGASLQGADLRRANLRTADLQGADLRGADLRGALMQNSDLSGADLTDTRVDEGNRLSWRPHDRLHRLPAGSELTTVANRRGCAAPATCLAASATRMTAGVLREVLSVLFQPIRWLLLAASLSCGAVPAAPLDSEEARAAIDSPDPAAQRAAIERLAEVGTMDDVDRLAARLADSDEQIRAGATAALWQIWSRSGDAEIDALLARGTEQMQSFDFADALATFNQVVEKKPGFAEGWNKRATVLFLMGENRASLRDCAEVLRRNPKHFGALAGAGQNHAQLGEVEQAIDFFKRALVVNPYLPGPAASIVVLQQVLRSRERDKI